MSGENRKTEIPGAHRGVENENEKVNRWHALSSIMIESAAF
jgi:hypothetical protein